MYQPGTIFPTLPTTKNAVLVPLKKPTLDSNVVVKPLGQYAK